MGRSGTVGPAKATQRAREPRQGLSAARRTTVERRQLEAALEAALSVVGAALELLDAMDGDAEVEVDCEDEGAACEDEGFDADREPDRDGDGMPERSWRVDGRDVHMVDGAARSWAERCGHDGQASAPRDVCDAHTPAAHLHDAGGSPGHGQGCHSNESRLHDGGASAAGGCALPPPAAAEVRRLRHEDACNRQRGAFDTPSGPFTATRDCHDGNTLDPDDAPDPLVPPRFGFGCAR